MSCKDFRLFVYQRLVQLCYHFPPVIFLLSSQTHYCFGHCYFSWIFDLHFRDRLMLGRGTFQMQNNEEKMKYSGFVDEEKA